MSDRDDIDTIRDALDGWPERNRTVMAVERVAASLAEKDEEIGRLREVLRVREESQIPMVPTGAQKTMDVLADRVAALETALRSLHNEVDCRIEHGANSNGHLEYVRDRLRAALAGSEETNAFDDLVTGSEAGRRLGISRQRIYQLARRRDFPAPVGQLGQSTIWRWSELSEWETLRRNGPEGDRA